MKQNMKHKKNASKIKNQNYSSDAWLSASERDVFKCPRDKNIKCEEQWTLSVYSPICEMKFKHLHAGTEEDIIRMAELLHPFRGMGTLKCGGGTNVRQKCY